MARIPDAFIDDLLARTDIVELVGTRVPLKKQGREYSARCPFHDERSPSFTVSPTKQFFHCFGCGAHGTAITFLMNFDRMEFLDAIEELAKRVGMEIPKDTRQRNEDGETRVLYAMLDAANQQFQQQLANDQKAASYLDERGVDAKTRESFSIGYAVPGFSVLRDALGTDATRLTTLERAGLMSRNERGNVYDKFRDRIMFPIHDRRGRVIGFGGRVLSPEGSPKYLNSPETALFHKGRELYGLWQARQLAQKLERLIVVEGYMDVLALVQHGLPESVATLGTATTADHAELLFRNAQDVYFCFDGDQAGRRAAVKAMEAVLPRMRDGRQAFFLFLPEGEDPDSLIRKERLEGFNERLAGATPLSQFFFDVMASGVNTGTLDGKAKLAEKAKPLLAGVPDGAFGDLMQQRLQTLTGVGQAQPSPVRGSRRQQHVPAPRRSMVRMLIHLLLQQPSLGQSIQPPYPFAALTLAGVPLLIEILDVIHQRPGITTGPLLEHFSEREEAEALHKLAGQTVPGEETGWRADLAGAVDQLALLTLQQRREELQARLVDLNDAEKHELRELLKVRQRKPGQPADETN
jgi:DNA primase